MEKEDRKIRAAILIVSCVMFVLLLARWRWSAPVPQRDLSAAVVVEVKGDVPKPGIYVIDKERADVAAAAVMAGCPWKIPAAAAPQKLSSGQSLEIRRQEKEIIVKFGRIPGAALLACGLKLDLNSASFDELLLIPHMRPQIAASIVERRRRKLWEKPDDLTEIHGVGLKTAQKLQDYLEARKDAQGAEKN